MGSGRSGGRRRRYDRGRGDCCDRECLCGADIQLLSAALLPAASGDLLTVRAIGIGLIVFTPVFGSALLAIYVQSGLPEQHRSADSKAVVKLGSRWSRRRPRWFTACWSLRQSAYDEFNDPTSPAHAELVDIVRRLAAESRPLAS